jgi:hypothetical protein
VTLSSRTPKTTRMTHLCHSAVDFAVLHNGPDAVALKFIAAPLSREQLADLIQIPPRK